MSKSTSVSGSTSLSTSASVVRSKSQAQSQPILELENVSRSFGGIRAVTNASFSVRSGAITGLIGPNGAGKSTIFNLVTGYLHPDQGSIRFAGREITGMAPHEIIRLGIARTFQIPRGLSALTVRENLMLAPAGQKGEHPWSAWLRRGVVRAQEERVARRAGEVLELLDLQHLAGEYAGNLSGGQKKLLELGRALMQDATLILLDEPGAGVNPTLMRRLVGVLAKLRDEGRTLLLIEHDMELIDELCDWVVVMDAGRPLVEGIPADIRREPRVLAAHMGVAAPAYVAG